GGSWTRSWSTSSIASCGLRASSSSRAMCSGSRSTRLRASSRHLARLGTGTGPWHLRGPTPTAPRRRRRFGADKRAGAKGAGATVALVRDRLALLLLASGALMLPRSAHAYDQRVHELLSTRACHLSQRPVGDARAVKLLREKLWTWGTRAQDPQLRAR